MEYTEFLKAKIGRRLGYNDIVLGIYGAGYTDFGMGDYKYTKNSYGFRCLLVRAFL